MEVKSESTHEISIFCELFNEILSEIKGRNYKFNPKSIMVDENGANYCAIRNVFGLEFATSKVLLFQYININIKYQSIHTYSST